MNKSKKIALVDALCVACGTCIKTCPVNAITVSNGVCAVVRDDKCVGCGKCSLACPAGVISIIPREAL